MFLYLYCDKCGIQICEKCKLTVGRKERGDIDRQNRPIGTVSTLLQTAFSSEAQTGLLSTPRVNEQHELLRLRIRFAMCSARSTYCRLGRRCFRWCWREWLYEIPQYDGNKRLASGDQKHSVAFCTRLSDRGI